MAKNQKEEVNVTKNIEIKVGNFALDIIVNKGGDIVSSRLRNTKTGNQVYFSSFDTLIRLIELAKKET